MRTMLTSVLATVLTLVFVAAQGCAEKKMEKKGMEKGAEAGMKGEEPVLLEFEEIDLAPATEKKVAVKSGKAESAKAPEDSGLMITVSGEGDMLMISAAENAKMGTHELNVMGKGKHKAGMLKVHVKKPEAAAPEGKPAAKPAGKPAEK